MKRLKRILNCSPLNCGFYNPNLDPFLHCIKDSNIGVCLQEDQPILKNKKEILLSLLKSFF